MGAVFRIHGDFKLGRGKYIMKHYLTKYTENGIRYAEAWIQLEFFGKVFCISKKRIEV